VLIDVIAKLLAEPSSIAASDARSYAFVKSMSFCNGERRDCERVLTYPRPRYVGIGPHAALLLQYRFSKVAVSATRINATIAPPLFYR
jgi:hypothetical protein